MSTAPTMSEAVIALEKQRETELKEAFDGYKYKVENIARSLPVFQKLIENGIELKDICLYTCTAEIDEKDLSKIRKILGQRFTDVRRYAHDETTLRIYINIAGVCLRYKKAYPADSKRKCKIIKVNSEYVRLVCEA